MVEIDLRFLEIRLFYLHRRLGLVERGRGVVEIGLRRGVLGDEFLFPARRDLRQLQRRPRVREVAVHLMHNGLKRRGIDLRDDIAGFHR